MYRNAKESQLSEMEAEFELEMDDEFEFENTGATEESELESYETDENYESDDYEIDDLEIEEYAEEPQNEYEWLETDNSDYGERFFELSQREFESESEIDEAVDNLLTEMEQEFFLGGVLKKAKGLAQKIAKKGVDLAKKAGINLPSIEALKSMLGPVSGLLKGNLGALIKPALKAALSAHPAGAALMPVLKGFGFESGMDSDANRDAFNRYAEVAREAFENLAQDINENVDNPLEASRLATNAFQKAVKKHHRAHHGRHHGRRQVGGLHKKKVRRIYAQPGEVIVVIQRK
ncbi:MAG: hypothetical protein LUM44_20830 [Pyrinomonadaceae bacterium]|nr:hypothetical protein [Pyrinomonadaceae bacterium]